ncbi:MAG: hypothetical protein Alpg2KO_20570 [Alphaproteobacteria bacterium]
MSKAAHLFLNLSAIRQDFLASLSGHIEHIEEFQAFDASASASEQARKALAERMHQLAGSAGSFGYPLISEVASEIEVGCRGLSDTPISGKQLADLLDELRKMCSEAASTVETDKQSVDGIQAAEFSSSWQSKMNILVVEDDPAIAELLRRTVISFADVSTCRTAEDALRLIRQKRPDLLLLDHHLPGDTDGLTLLESIRADHRMAFIPVILLSGDDSTANQQRAVMAHVADFIPKPFSTRDIIERIHERLALIGQSVLIVDDDPSIRSLLKHVFRCFGCSVTVARTGDQALETAQQKQPDIVVMDQWLPGLSGTDTARSLRQRMDKARKMPIVFISARPDAQCVSGSTAVGGADFLLKPVPVHRLLQSCSKALWDHDSHPVY